MGVPVDPDVKTYAASCVGWICGNGGIAPAAAAVPVSG